MEAGKDPSADSNNSLFSNKRTGVAVVGMFAVCCAFLFPCVYKKRTGATTHDVLSRDEHSGKHHKSLIVLASQMVGLLRHLYLLPVDYGSSSEVIAAPEKFPGSPFRGPGSPFRVPPSPSRFSMSPKMTAIGSLHLSMSQVLKATRSFSPSMQIGEGGFGTVYKAGLEDGQVVAIKRAKRVSPCSLKVSW